MSAIPTSRRFQARRCAVCGKSLEGRDRRAKVCSHACAVAKSRGQRRGGLCPERACFHCGERFIPRRTDAIYCGGCRRTEPWRTAPPHEIRESLDGPALVSWLEGQAPDFRARLNGELRTVQRWGRGETRPTVWAVDTVLTALGLAGLELAEIPSHLWVQGDRRAKRAKHTCQKCGEQMREPGSDGLCGFCAEELRDLDLAVAA